MTLRRIAITAGYLRSPHAIALSEMLARDGHRITSVVAVRGWSPRRMRAWLRKSSSADVIRQARRLVDPEPNDALDRLRRAEGISDRTFKIWTDRHGSPLAQVRNLEHRTAVSALREGTPELVIYCGGGILPHSTLAAIGVPVLNGHLGPLPAVRGMHAPEWSLLLNEPIGVTVHLIDSGIDTGPILDWVPVAPIVGESLEDLRARLTVVAIQRLRVTAASRRLEGKAQPTPPMRQCFALAPVLREMARAKLNAIQESP